RIDAERAERRDVGCGEALGGGEPLDLLLRGLLRRPFVRSVLALGLLRGRRIGSEGLSSARCPESIGRFLSALGRDLVRGLLDRRSAAFRERGLLPRRLLERAALRERFGDGR